MKHTICAALIVISSSAVANQHQPFQNNFFNSGFNNSVWSNFNDQFQQFNDEMRSMQNRDIFSTQANRYFDDKTNHYMIELKAQDLTENSIHIVTKNNAIHISGNIQKIEKTANSSKSSSSQFSQSYSLPYDADEENVNVEFKDGLLIISIPKLVKTKTLVNETTIK